MRKALAAHMGKRFAVVATVKQFGSRRGWKGRDEPTILLVDLCTAATSENLCDHLWFKAGKWNSGLKIGDRIRVEARVSQYRKGYRGYRDDAWDAPPPSIDWRLGRPIIAAEPEDPRDVTVEPPPLPDENEDTMVSHISLRKFQEQLDRNCLDEIALLLLALTYGEMIELADAIWSAQPEGSAITKDNLPTLLHRWSESRSTGRPLGKAGDGA